MRRILINNIKMPIDHKIQEALIAAQEIVRQHCFAAKNFEVYRQSLDARRKNDIHYVYTVSAEVSDTAVLSHDKNITETSVTERLDVKRVKLNGMRPVVVGMGPCGLFAAYVLALSGNPPLIIERGADVGTRNEKVREFWRTGRLDESTNVQFGEGGAGTFSDGKLNTGVKDKHQRFILKTFTQFGAPDDIMYKAKPHIGTDELSKVLVNMRKRLIELGCEIRFNTRFTGYKTRNGEICEIELNGNESIKCERLFLAIGHSSRDTYEMLLNSGMAVEAKPFAAGVRIEHRQSDINRAQYGDDISGLPPADYKLVHRGKDRSCYSFCMCPGGTVVNASSECGHLVVNGMSNHARDAENANSALVVQVRPSDFESENPLSGIVFQRKYERAAFELGNGAAPIQLARDFVRERQSDALGCVKPSFTGDVRLSDLRLCLPEFITESLKDGLNDFEHKISGFLSGDGIMTGVEMRTSAPIRIMRGCDFCSVSVRGIYPMGEGAGYAGGIVSAALDGVKVALSVLNDE